jgi:ATP-dependent helicase/DNAse subunit B
MPHPLTVVVGPARCGKTHYLVGQYRQILEAATTSVGQALWLAPTSRGAAAIREQLVRGNLAACLDPGVTTFEILTRRILAATAAPPRATSPFTERVLVRRVVDAALQSKRLDTLSAMARRSSFVDLVVEHFHELKRHGVTPAGFSRSIGSRGDRHLQTELAHLYTAYEQLLVEHRLADEEGRHGAARDALKDSPVLFADLQLVVADGFTDFTHTQLEILDQLARRAGRLLISLPGEEERSSGRSELFAKSAAALAELRLHFPKLTIENLPCRGTDWPALDHIAHQLFQHPREVPAPSAAVAASLDRLQIVAAAGVHDEIVELARRIKRQLVATNPPTGPGDVVVVFRNLRQAAPRIRDVFDEFGIPYSLEAGRPLAATTVMRTLLDLLRLDAEDWPFRRVVSIVTNNELATADRKARAAAEWLLRDLQIDRGRRQLFDRLLPLRELASTSGNSEPTPNPRPKTHLDHQAQAAATALPFLQTLAATHDTLPAAATPSEWIAAIARLAAQLRIHCFTPAGSDIENTRSENIAAWQAITEHLQSLEQLAAWLGEPPQLTRPEVLDVLVDLAERESLPRPTDDTGRVRVLSAKTARTVAAKHVFLAGMSEQAFPSPDRAGGLYSTADYRFFAAAADQKRAAAELPTVERSQEEMLLFYEVLSRAEQRLTISYPALDDKAQVLSPSPYVTEVERAVAPAAVAHLRASRPSPLPAEGLPLSVADWRVQAVHEALAGDASLLSGMFRAGASGSTNALESALRIVSSRSRRDGFGPAEGLLESDAVRARLARRFGSEHLWSPSQWETFAVCPYRFFMDHVLGLEPLGELVLETDHRRRGTLVHRVLAEFHRNAQELLGPHTRLSEHDAAKFVAQFENLLDALVRATPYHGVEAALVQLDRLQIAKWAPRYYDEHGKYDAAFALEEPLAPAFLEWRFGPPRAGEKEYEDPRSTAEPFLLSIGKEQIRITGRIDRIDVGQAGQTAVFNVIDYKSGKAPGLRREHIESGMRLQPALYVLAAQQLLFKEGDVPVFAGYWSLAEGIKLRGSLRFGEIADGGAIATSEWTDTLQPQLTQLVGHFVSDIRQGNFPVASRDEHCTSHCDFSTVCRIAQVRSLGKQWFPEEPDAASESDPQNPG